MKDIRLQVRVRAKPEAAYKALAMPGDLLKWWRCRLSGKASSGTRFSMKWAGPDSGIYPQALGESRGVFVDLEPGRKLAWIWEGPSVGEGVPRLVSFFLLPAGRETEVSLQHCGFEPGPRSESLYQGFRRGWRDALAGLKRHLEGPRSRRTVRARKGGCHDR